MGAGGYAERTARLFRVAGLLKRYADQYKLAVVVTNQVGVLSSALLSFTAASSLFLKGSYHAYYYDLGPYRPLPQ